MHETNIRGFNILATILDYNRYGISCRAFQATVVVQPPKTFDSVCPPLLVVVSWYTFPGLERHTSSILDV